MDDVVKNMLENGLTPDVLFQLFLIIIAVIIVLWIRGWIIRWLAYTKFKGSIEISKDTVVREATPTGYVDFILEDVGMTSIVLRSVDKKLKKITPTKFSNDRDWVTVQRRDDQDLARDMELQIEDMSEKE